MTFFGLVCTCLATSAKVHIEFLHESFLDRGHRQPQVLPNDLLRAAAGVEDLLELREVVGDECYTCGFESNVGSLPE